MGNTGTMLTAILRDRTAASRVYEWLQERGYRPDEINVLMSAQTRAALDRGARGGGPLKSASMTSEGMAAGGAIGTAVGATVGAIAAIGTTITLPGLNLVIAGPLLLGLAGGGAGAVAGGVIGALAGLGIPESNARAYEEALRGGGVVLGIVPHSPEDAEAIEEHFEEQGADNIVYI